jgi:hypothetical protein
LNVPGRKSAASALRRDVGFRFVLSFQFESVYAARLGKALVFPGPVAL